MFERGFLILMTLVWLPYGAMCFIDPGLLAESSGVVATTPTATTEIRAMYGGLQAAIGALALLAAIKSHLAKSALIALAMLSGGLLTARLIGLAMDGGYTGYTGMAIGLEVFICTVSSVLLRGSREPLVA
ncbi:MAG: DUF4345 family protein [Myxococcales bacterium]